MHIGYTFRYRYPREGTETELMHNGWDDVATNLDIDIPERGRKPEENL